MNNRVVLMLVLTFVVASSCTRPVRPDFIEARVSPDNQSIQVFEGGKLVFQPKFTSSDVSPDLRTVAYVSDWPDSPAMRTRVVLVEVGKPAGLPTIVKHFSDSEVTGGNKIHNVYWSPDSNFVSVYLYQNFGDQDTKIKPHNVVLVAAAKSGSTESVSEIVRQEIDAEVDARVRKLGNYSLLPNYHTEMAERPNCTYSPKWNADGSLSFVWDYAGPEFSKPSFHGTYYPKSRVVKLDF